jgi:ABC-type transporter Mla MlaB component
VIRVDRAANGKVVFLLSGGITTEEIPYLEQLLRSETQGSKIALDLKDILHVNDAGVAFLCRCETAGIALRNCPTFIRDWMQLQKGRQ